MRAPPGIISPTLATDTDFVNQQNGKQVGVERWCWLWYLSSREPSHETAIAVGIGIFVFLQPYFDLERSNSAIRATSCRIRHARNDAAAHADEHSAAVVGHEQGKHAGAE